MKRAIVAAPLCVITLLFTGCASTPKQAPSTTTSQTVANTPQALLKQARSALSPQRERLLLDAARLLREQGELEQARLIVQTLTLTESSLSIPDQMTLNRLAIELELQRGQPENALVLADRLAALPLDQQPLDDLRATLAQLADVYELNGQSLKAAYWLTRLSGLEPAESAPDFSQRIWTHLSGVPTGELEDAMNLEPETTGDWYGWLELAVSIKQALGRLELQRQALEQWQTLWPGHPAALYPPEELTLIARFEAVTPKTVLVALPQSGRLGAAGQAIRDGLIAAWYQLNPDTRPRLLLADSNQLSTESLGSLLDRESIDAIVGPLDKTRIRQWIQAGFSTPMLAMNTPDSTTPDAAISHYFFALSGEDELRQIAERLSAEGRRRIAVIYPDTDWARDAVNSFRSQASLLGVQITSEQTYGRTDNLSTQVGKLVGTSESRQRGRTLQTVLGEKLDYRLRARSDIDAIIMIATPVSGRQIKPLLAFHYAGGIPVYATSLIHSGVVAPEKDKDLNGVRFPEMPWMLTRSNPVKVAVTVEGAQPAYLRLYALGADALEIIRRLPFLKAFDAFELDGVTGLIYKATPRRLGRRLQWAYFENGQVFPETGSP